MACLYTRCQMLIHEYIEIGAISSLVFILLVLAVSICASIFIAPAKAS